MKLRLLFVPSLALVLAACGGSPPANSPSGDPHAHHHGEGHGHEHAAGHAEAKGHGHAEHGDHEKLPAPLKEFHSVLSPLWHAEKGAARTDKTCAEAKNLEQKAEATGNADLIKATKALAEECAKEGRAEFETRFHAVHESFHAAIKK